MHMKWMERREYLVYMIAQQKEYYTDIDRDGHEILRFGGLPRELYFPKGSYLYPEVRSTEGK